MRFPVTIRHRSSKVKIYAPAKNFAYYRLSFKAAGKRQLQTFATYSEAKTAGEKKVKELHGNPSAASLSAGQAQDALAALERWETFRLTVGTYRGNNTTYAFAVPAGALVAGTNTLTVFPISGSGTRRFLSAGYGLDCIE